MPVVTENIDLPGDFDAQGVVVDLQLVTTGGEPLKEAYDQTAGITIAGFHRFAASTTGTWSTTLVGNGGIVPSGTAWRRSVRALTIPPTTAFLEVPTTGGPYRVDQILTDASASVTASALSAHAVDDLLHGGGQLLGYADRSTAFTTSSTAAVDVTGATVTFTVPDGPYVVECGAFASIEEGREGAVAVSSGSRTSGVSTMTTSTAHGFTVGRVVVVAVADTTYNGAFAVASIPTTTRFTYAQTGVGDDAASGTGAVAGIEVAGAAGTIQITLSDNTIIGQDGFRARINNDISFLSRRVVVPNAHHAPTVGTTITYKMRALSSSTTSDLQLIGPFFGFDDQPYIAAVSLGGDI